MDFSGTSYLPAYLTGKEIELVWDELGMMGVMVNMLAGRAAAQGTWAGCSNVKFKGGNSTALSQRWTKPLQQTTGQEKVEGRQEQTHRGAQGSGAHHLQGEDGGMAVAWPAEGDTLSLLQIPVGRGGRKQHPSFAFGLHDGQRLG